MRLSAVVKEWKQPLTPVLTLAALVAAAIAIGWFVPGRLAAIVLGVLAAAVFCLILLRDAGRGTRIAILWAAAGVCADAAYAKLNDQAPVTVANALVKVADAAVKLVNGLIQSTGAVDARVKPASFTPDFVWALILASIVILWLSFSMKRR